MAARLAYSRVVQMAGSKDENLVEVKELQWVASRGKLWVVCSGLALAAASGLKRAQLTAS